MDTTFYLDQEAAALLTSECVSAIEWHLGASWDCQVFYDDIQQALSDAILKHEEKDLLVKSILDKLG